MDIVLVCLFMIFGILFLILEIFLLPGITLGGIVGTLFLVAAVWYAFAVLGITAGYITLLSSVILLGVSIWLFIRSRLLDKMSLHTEVNGKVDPVNDGSIQVGDKGHSVSRLAPIGKVMFHEEVVEAKSFDGFIDADRDVEVVSAQFNEIVVKLIEK